MLNPFRYRIHPVPDGEPVMGTQRWAFWDSGLVDRLEVTGRKDGRET